VDTDRNLLFAVLALQADLLDRERFVQACTLWAARKDTPIADLLIQQGWLTPEDRADVQRLLDRKLKKHGGDVQATLVEAVGPAARDALFSADDPDVERSLASLAGAGPADELSTAPPADGPGRNLVYEEIGRGGMGRVFRGRDPALGRDLAVKVLREDRGGDPGLERRFVEEAQIGGQLQHPGLVPVYELGRFADRRPYFTMKLVKGRTLADLLKERPDQARLLTIFEQVCQTVAYAHSKGVIHRDLKPANVMVGAFGEVQVMDWGLAKVLGGPDGDPEATTAGTVVRTVRSGSTAEEDGRTGVVGTPAYMAPEQARGEIEQVDARADVFGLGAILCVILTGQPPHAAADREEVRRRAAAGDLAEAFARLGRCGADTDLVALCKWCLAPQRGQRPGDAGEVAARMAAYQAAVRERLRRAELQRAAAEARAIEERKRRRVTLALAAALLLLVAGGGGGAWWVQQRRQATDAGVARLMGEARLLHQQALNDPLAEGRKFDDARDTAGKARQLADDAGASAALRQEATALAQELEVAAKAAERDRVLLAALLEVRGPREGPTYRRDEQGFMEKLAEPSADEQFQAAFRAWGLDVDATPTAEAVARLGGRPGPVRTEVTAALDEWAAERRRQRRPEAESQRLTELAQALDDDPGTKRRELRALLARDSLARERALSALAATLRPVPVPYDAGWGEDRAHLRLLAEKADPAAEPVLGLLTLSRALQAAGEDALAERLLRAAVRARPREVVLHHALGQLLEGQQPPRWGEAVECYAAARALRPELGVSLANALVECGRVSEGLALYERLVTERPDNPWLHLWRGHTFEVQRLWKEAEAAAREALRLRPDDAVAHVNLGVALNNQGRHKEAEAAHHEALRLKPDDALAHFDLGKTLQDQGRFKEAEAAAREALRLKPDFAPAHNNLAGALVHQERWKEAEAAAREALRLKPDFAPAYSNLGMALHHQGREKEAEAAHREGIRLRPDDPLAHVNLGATLQDQGRLKEAEAAAREALRLKPDLAEAHNNLAGALHHQGRLKEAEAAYREALRLKPDDPLVHFNFGCALGPQGRLKEAEAAFREALRLKPDFAEAHGSLGTALHHQGREKEAEAAFREAVRFKPEDPLAHLNLGVNLQKQGRFLEALGELRRGHALGSKARGWSKPSADWVRQCERFVESDRKLPAVLRGEAEPATPAERLELADLCRLDCKRLYAAAARFYADAFAADPKLADDLDKAYRYNAAGSAVLAAAGQGTDAQGLPDKVRQMLRRQALTWLRADLVLRTQMAESGEPASRRTVQEKLQSWQRDAHLASVRDQAALDRLPDDARQQWHQLWDDVAALLKKVEDKK
jgi:serine/threonine-protein kinase